MTSPDEYGAPASAAAGLPRYRQIANALRDRILRREWAANDQLPGEEALADTFSVSKLTMRQALGVLLQEGLIRREHGRGTFIADGPLAPPTAPHPGETAARSVGGRRAEVRVLDTALVEGPVADFADLALVPPAPAFRLRRVQLVAGRPRVYAVCYLPPPLAARLTAADLRRSPLVPAIEKRLGVQVARARQLITAVLADEDAATHLEVPFGSADVLLKRIYWLATGEPACVAFLHHPGGRFWSEVALQRSGTRAAQLWTAAPPAYEREPL